MFVASHYAAACNGLRIHSPELNGGVFSRVGGQLAVRQAVAADIANVPLLIILLEWKFVANHHLDNPHLFAELARCPGVTSCGVRLLRQKWQQCRG